MPFHAPGFISLAHILALVLLVSRAEPAFASFASDRSAFGENTILYDSETGLRWLDVTASLNLSYWEIEDLMQPGGVFDGYRFATGEEVEQLFYHAGIDNLARVYTQRNYGAVMQLAARVGQTGSDGSCGIGCSFDYTEGWVWAGPPPRTNPFFAYMQMAWFDNTAGHDVSSPAKPIGKTDKLVSFLDAAKSTRGAWLVRAAPESSALMLGAAAVLALAVLDARRRMDRRVFELIVPTPRG